MNTVEVEAIHSGPVWTTFLRIHGIANILINCGWTDQFQECLISNAFKVYDEADVVLLCHSSVQHLGALPYAYQRYWKKRGHAEKGDWRNRNMCEDQNKGAISFFGTDAVCKMGRMSIMDALKNHQYSQAFDLFEFSDVQEAFGAVQRLRFYETVPFQKRGSLIVLQPIPAGHTLGGAAWKILVDGQLLLFGVNYNLTPEWHLDGCHLSRINYPDLFITDILDRPLGLHNMKIPAIRRILRESRNTLRDRGSVMLPVDIDGRLIELLIHFQIFWTSWRNNLTIYPIVFLSPTANQVIYFTTTLIDWMSFKIMNGFIESRFNPFKHLTSITVLDSLEAYRALPDIPHVVLVTPASMNFGFSRVIFPEIAMKSKNLLLFPVSPCEGTTAAYVHEMSNRNSDAVKEFSFIKYIVNPLSLDEMYNIYVEERRKRSVLDNAHEFLDTKDTWDSSKYMKNGNKVIPIAIADDNRIKEEMDEDDLLNEQWQEGKGSTSRGSVDIDLENKFPRNEIRRRQFVSDYGEEVPFVDSEYWKNTLNEIIIPEESNTDKLICNGRYKFLSIFQDERMNECANIDIKEEELENHEELRGLPMKRKRFLLQKLQAEAEEHNIFAPKIRKDEEITSEENNICKSNNKIPATLDSITDPTSIPTWKDQLIEWLGKEPMKYEVEQINLSMKCRCQVITGFEGVTAENLLRGLLISMAPKKVVFLPSSSQMTASFITSYLITSRVGINEVHTFWRNSCSFTSNIQDFSAECRDVANKVSTVCVTISKPRAVLEFHEDLYGLFCKRARDPLFSVQRSNAYCPCDIQNFFVTSLHCKSELLKNIDDDMRCNKTISSEETISDNISLVPQWILKIRNKIKDGENDDISNVSIGESVEQYRLVGNVYLRDIMSAVKKCLSSQVIVAPGGGGFFLADKASISRNLAKDKSVWELEGTIDPTYYLLRKIILNEFLVLDI